MVEEVYSDVSISQSRYFSFQENRIIRWNVRRLDVSISQSRYFSFQEMWEDIGDTFELWFQSRNRDTSLFRWMARISRTRFALR